MLRNNNRKPLQMHHQIHTLSYSAMLCKGPSVADVVQVNLPLCVWCCKNCGSGVSLSILQLKIVNFSTFNENNQPDAPIERKALSCRCRSCLCLLQLLGHILIYSVASLVQSNGKTIWLIWRGIMQYIFHKSRVERPCSYPWILYLVFCYKLYFYEFLFRPPSSASTTQKQFCIKL